ncbi:MAG: Mov34/MPN/PAD-1 family protein [Candidatus Brocadiia bacterium]
MSPPAHSDILAHAREDMTAELCGLLAGKLERDDFGPFARIEVAIAAAAAESAATRVTFTHKTWEELYRKLDTEYPDKEIIGWYHTHPGLGVFLSPMDLFIHENFFDLPHQVAFVVDPRGEDEGLFVWKEGAIKPAQAYWVGDVVRPMGLPQGGPNRYRPLGDTDVDTEGSVEPESGAAEFSWHALQFVLLVLCCLFVFFQRQAEAIVEKLALAIIQWFTAPLSSLKHFFGWLPFC